MPAFEENPTLDYMTPLLRHYVNLWSATKVEAMEADRYISASYPLWKRGIDRPQMHTSRGYSIVSHAADALVANQPTFKRVPRSRKDESKVDEVGKARNDRVERFLDAVFQTSMLEEHVSPFRTLAWYMMAYGYGVVTGPTWDDSDEPKEPERKKGQTDTEFDRAKRGYKAALSNWSPFKMHAPNPTEVLYEPFRKQSRFSIQIKHMLRTELVDIAQAMGGSFDPEGKPYEDIVTVEYFAQKFHSMYVADAGAQSVSKVVFIKENYFSVVPSVGAFAGFGYMPVASNQGNPSFLAVSILKPVFEILLSISRAMTATQNAVLAAGFLRPGTRKPVEEAEEELTGEKLLTGEEGDFWWMAVPNLPQYIFQQLAILLDDLEAATFSGGISGIRQAGVSTVGQQMQLSTAALRKFMNPARQMDYVASVMAQNMLRAIEVMDRTITVRGQTITPDDIDGYTGMDVTWKLLDPLLQLQQRQTAMREVELNLLPDEEYWDQVGYQDATRMRLGTNRQMVRRDPFFQQMLVKIVASSLDIQEFLGVEARANGGQGGLVDTRGNPLGGNGSIPRPENQETPGLGQIPLLNAMNPEDRM